MIVQGPDGARISFPDGTPPEAIKAAMAKHYGPPRSQRLPSLSGAFPEPKPLPRWIEGAAKAFVPAAAALGGLTGTAAGVGPIAGAGIAGGAAEALRQRFSGEPFSPSAVDRAAGQQALLELGGGLAAKSLGNLARPVMRRALGVGRPIAGEVKVGRSLLPDPVETAIQERIAATPKGAVKATQLRKNSAAILSGLIDRADATGQRLSTFEVTKHVRNLIRSNVVPGSEKRKILSDLVSFYADKGRQIPPVLLQEVKRYYQRQARSIYSAGAEGAFTLADQAHGQFAEALARGAREQLETIPGVAAQNAATQRLIGVEKAVTQAVRRPPPPFEFWRPGTYPMVSRLMDQPALSHQALLLSDPKLLALARQSPRTFAYLWRLSNSAPSDVTNQ